MDGMINIRKEKDYTSHDVVARLRGILKQKKIGHTGTLDPQAEGVLPVALGAATKLCELFSDRSKTYKAVVRLGIATDTEDMTGTVLAEDDSWKQLNKSDIENAVMSFLGEYDQVPPMYSALKVDGHKLYEYARREEVIERKARRLQIYDIKVTDIDLPCFSIEVSCSKGTYIRTLSKDIAEKLGTCGCMEALLRTRVGEYSLSDSLTLEQVEKLKQEGKLDVYVSSVDSVFEFLDAIKVKADGEKQLRNGNFISYLYTEKYMDKCGECSILGDWNDCVRIYDYENQFIGVYRKDDEQKHFKPEKLFFINNGGTK